MPVPQDDIGKLLPLLEMAYQAEQLKMAKIITRIQDLRSQLQALERPRRASAPDINVATMAGVDLLWERWVQDRKVLINQELALASRDRELAKALVVKALSKLEAAKQVSAYTVDKARIVRERRSSW
jgi:hypothetical protein